MMAKESQNDFVKIHEKLPIEIFVKILRLLNFNDVCLARRTCKDWKNIIDKFELVEAASCKKCLIL